MSQKHTGNRCQHDPKNYRKPTLFDGKHQPSIIRMAKKRVQYLVIKARGELRESVLAVLSTIPDYLDVYSGKMGIPTEQGWLPFSWQVVRNRLPWMSDSRFFAALRYITRVGYLESEQKIYHPSFITKDSATTSGWAVSEKTILDKFWIDLRLLKMKRQAEQRKKAELEKKAKFSGKKLADFFIRIISKTKIRFDRKKAAQEAKPTSDAKVVNEGRIINVSPRAAVMIIAAQLFKHGINEAYKEAERIFEANSYASLQDPLKYI